MRAGETEQLQFTRIDLEAGLRCVAELLHFLMTVRVLDHALLTVPITIDQSTARESTFAHLSTRRSVTWDRSQL